MIFTKGYWLKKKAEPDPIEIPDDFFGAPWIFTDLNLLGLLETDPKLNARFVPEWKFMKRASSYKTLAGNTYAWCALLVNALLRKIGIKGTDDPAAASFSIWGKACPFWFGSVLPIEHDGGGRHVCFFLYWIDEKNGVCATLDGNRGNKFCVARTVIAKGEDKLVPSPRWSKDWKDGRHVSMAEVLKKYPYLKVGNVGTGTR